MIEFTERVVVLTWFDVFTFDDPPVLRCPDCDMASPALRDVWEAAKWANAHYRTECNA